jgi:hypothetical protein
MLTSLGEDNEKLILAELDPIIQKWAKRTKADRRYVESAVAFLWDRRERATDDWMRANEVGPYGGR